MSELTTEQLTQLYQDWSAMGEKRERERINILLQKILDDRAEAAKGGLYSKTIGIQEAMQLITGEVNE